VIAFVEVRRVLFSTYSDEVPAQCVQSVLEIRNFLTETIGQGHIGDKLTVKSFLVVYRFPCDPSVG
jgi:hypothetical protein